ncbi:MAG: hypothetical protein BGO69_05075 [Bacteroidetes bacterium 46-16]|nr:MAG: hypothetical protein BGO69_05075 [Bacteroidetes bacterium 46-16]
MNKSLLNIKAISAAITFCLFTFSLVLYSSCTQKDQCEDVVCNNGGVCIEGACSCLNGFTGVNCEKSDAEKFVGLYTGVNKCNNTNHFKIDTFVKDQVYIKMTVGNASCLTDISLLGHVVGDSIVFPEQGFLDGCQQSYAFSANGAMVGDSLHMLFRYDFPAYKDTCTFDGIK